MYNCVPCTIREVLVDLLHVATVIDQDGTAELIAHSHDTGPQRRQTTATIASLQALQHDEPTANQWAIAEWDNSQTNLPELIQDIKDSTASAVSDGSFKNCNGTSAFMLCSEQLENRIIGVNSVPGTADKQSAYRSELSGVSGIIHILKLLCLKFKIQEGSVQIGLDGDQALKAAAGTWPLKAGQADYDLIKDIRAKIKALPITITWKWIKGHQDDNEDFRHLDSWAQCNIQCDSLAKLYWNHCLQMNKRLPNQKVGNNGWTLWFNARKRSHVEITNLYSQNVWRRGMRLLGRQRPNISCRNTLN
jgi:ribonuclease HI